jgi:4-carboxymuconolactone decarboxylase
MSSNPPLSVVMPDDVRIVSPALAKYTQASISDDLWRRPELSPRDRSLLP